MKDNRNTIIISILLLCIMIMLMTIVASADINLNLSARAAVLYEPTSDNFIYEKNADLRLPMASTTKIMTALLTLENCMMDEVVKIPPEAVGVEGSSLYLRAGDMTTVKDLLYSVMLQSANDAATALAMKISGDIAQFSELMNKRAAELQLRNTHFENPHGLHANEHYTTARDLAIIAAVALGNPTFKDIASTYKYTFSISGKPRTVINHNKLLRNYDGAIGVKTGYTRSSGRCLVSAAEREGLRLIAVTLNAPDDWRDHTIMLNKGFELFEAVNIRDITETDFVLPVLNSGTRHITAAIKDACNKSPVKRRDARSFEAKLDIKPYVVAPVAPGDKVGEVVILSGTEEVMRVDIVATESAKPMQSRRYKFFNKHN